MGRGIERKLTAAAVRSFAKRAADGDVVYGAKLSDGGGLQLVANRAGSVSWRYRYSHAGTERSCSIGTYPEVTLEAARVELAELRRIVAQGRDPVTERHVQRAAIAVSTGDTFEAVFRRWLEIRRGEWKPDHYKRSARAIERDVLPYLGRLPVASITPAMVAGVVERIIARGVRDTAKKILHNVKWIFQYAQAQGLRIDNPAAPAVEVIPRKRDVEHFPALLTFPALHDVLRRSEVANTDPAIRLASLLIAYTGSRIENAASAEWSEFDLYGDSPTWTIPRHKLKRKHTAHRVPLYGRVLQQLRHWHSAHSSPCAGFVFPSRRTKYGYISCEGIEKLYREQLGLRDIHVPHGWRSALMTLARDAGHARDVTDMALHHQHDNSVAMAYDRGERWSQRQALFAWWAAELDKAFQ